MIISKTFGSVKPTLIYLHCYSFKAILLDSEDVATGYL